MTPLRERFEAQIIETSAKTEWYKKVISNDLGESDVDAILSEIYEDALKEFMSLLKAMLDGAIGYDGKERLRKIINMYDIRII